MIQFNFGSIELEIVIKIFLAITIGFFIGLERKGKHFGLGSRTTMLVCMGACLFTIIGTTVFDGTNLTRIVQGLAAGIGFIGAAIIWRQEEKHWIGGLTTAATIWVLTALGIAIGAGQFFLGIFSAVIILIILLIKRAGIE